MGAISACDDPPRWGSCGESLTECGSQGLRPSSRATKPRRWSEPASSCRRRDLSDNGTDGNCFRHPARWSDCCDLLPDLLLEVWSLFGRDLHGRERGKDVADDEVDADRALVRVPPALDARVAEFSHRELACPQPFHGYIQIAHRAETRLEDSAKRLCPRIRVKPHRRAVVGDRDRTALADEAHQRSERRLRLHEMEGGPDRDEVGETQL